MQHPGNLNSRIRQLDLLRGISVVMIGCCHFGLFTADGTPLLNGFHADHWIFKTLLSSVFFFFILSGLLVPLSLHRGGYTLRDIHIFLLKRLCRVHLPFLAALTLILLLQAGFAWKAGLSFSIDSRQFLANTSLSAEYLHIPWYNPIFWTLAIELQFYVLIAFIFPLLDKGKWWFIFLFLGTGALLHYFIPDKSLWWVYTPYFATGMGLYTVFKEPSKMNNGFLAATVVISTVILVISGDFIFSCAPAVATLIAFLPMRAPRWITYPGQISYSFYLTHGLSGMTLLYFTRSWPDTALIDLVRILLAFAVSMLFSTAFYYAVEAVTHHLAGRLNYRQTGGKRKN